MNGIPSFRHSLAYLALKRARELPILTRSWSLSFKWGNPHKHARDLRGGGGPLAGGGADHGEQWKSFDTGWPTQPRLPCGDEDFESTLSEPFYESNHVVGRG